MLPNDNVLSHKVVRGNISAFGKELLSQPPYSPDLVPCDYHLFYQCSKLSLRELVIFRKMAERKIDVSLEGYPGTAREM